MAIEEPKSNQPSGRKLGRFLYISIFVISTCAVSVILSIRGNILFDPITAIVAGIFAGFAFVMFQLTYVKFIVKSSWRIRGEPLD
ncbi:MAG: hypothetical protein AM325_012240 [Candidatus Thorarchaeota archaeon SMTZ1-45]|nr:MAG: hypothetical protein AM325_13925 [Candidatus Thorarchaeota archaeon SMTZ1-45]